MQWPNNNLAGLGALAIVPLDDDIILEGILEASGWPTVPVPDTGQALARARPIC
jgi:hypothetical protein